MKKSALLFILPALMLSGCGNTPVDPDPEMSVNYTLDALINQESEGYNLSFTMKDSYFNADATTFNKDIALLSNGKSLMVATEKTVKDFYSAMKFDKISVNYPEHTEDTIQYAIAHKRINDFDLISVAVNGHNYGLEWKNNALLGLEGDHQGFAARANDIYAALKDYISTNSYSNYKLWITGYSRGGAISNILSHYILSKEEFAVAKKDMFVYTFEAPKGLDEDNAPKYDNVFNILYSGDTVTYMAPSEYGFARCGVDIDLYQSSLHTDEVLYNFDEDISIPEFKACPDLDNKETLETEADVCKYFFKYLSRDGESVPDQELYIPTRADFVNEVQPTVQFALAMVFTLPSEVKTQMIEDLKKLGFGALALMNDPVALADFIERYLITAEFPYEREQLVNDCKVLIRIVGTDSTLVSAFLAYALGGENDFANDLIRSFMVHYPEVGHALLKDYLANL